MRHRMRPATPPGSPSPCRWNPEVSAGCHRLGRRRRGREGSNLVPSRHGIAVTSDAIVN
ncbi:hypothetical protein BN381_80123 [Candidatus Microthrix parvicella RN1]|uniref:Uncharacterized protein n=1 Tax=Candidatus Neomicrothrix parvicella RN1 TaxID=1229780 RepID=R4Z4D5_9ACTN|nr:hypothetical protein BN381_80123 [Candidatus Microthrix parvicella RN1]